MSATDSVAKLSKVSPFSEPKCDGRHRSSPAVRVQFPHHVFSFTQTYGDFIMKAFLLIWALMSFGPQGEVAQSVHLTRAECQASLGKIATSIIHPHFVTDPQMILGPDPIGPIQANGMNITAPPDPTIRSGIKGNATDKDHNCVQFRAER